MSTLIDSVGIVGPHRGDEVTRALDLLGNVDLVPGRGLHATDIDDVGAVAHHVVDPLHRGVEREGRAPVIERVRRAIDNRHDLQGVVAQWHSLCARMPATGGAFLHRDRTSHPPALDRSVELVQHRMRS